MQSHSVPAYRQAYIVQGCHTQPYLCPLCCSYQRGWVGQEDQDYSRTMLNKLSKQQHLLLQELERTKRRLREEIWAREGRTGIPGAARPTSPDPLDSWPRQQAHGSAGARLPSTALDSPSNYRSKKRSQAADGGRGQHTSGGASLKRSRSEAGIRPTEIDVEGEHVERARATRPEESHRLSPSTRIDMLPVMSSTGE